MCQWFVLKMGRQLFKFYSAPELTEYCSFFIGFFLILSMGVQCLISKLSRSKVIFKNEMYV